MASIEGTKNFISNFPDIKSKLLGKTEFQVSICGFGCYRVDDGIPQHHNALEKAILSGINVIDTSSNYSDGGSEIFGWQSFEQIISENKIRKRKYSCCF